MDYAINLDISTTVNYSIAQNASLLAPTASSTKIDASPALATIN